jgi:hypothetical protein
MRGGRRSLSILRPDALRHIRRMVCVAVHVLGIGARLMTEVGRLLPSRRMGTALSLTSICNGTGVGGRRSLPSGLMSMVLPLASICDVERRTSHCWELWEGG